MSANDDYFQARSGGDRGDAAGEHLDMHRGRYDAWAWVVFAYLIEAALFAFPIWLAVGFAMERLLIAAAQANGSVAVPYLVLRWLPSAAGAVFGLSVAWLVFHDRWRVIEAFSSRFCSGISRFSLLYVPLIALGYANVRGVKKLTGG